MRSEDLQIIKLEGGYSVTVSGRANFDYAVPLRTLAEELVAGNWIQIDLENCTAMDSTFMGVLTMMVLKLRKSGSKVREEREARFRNDSRKHSQDGAQVR